MKELLERELGSLEEERDGLREEVEGGRGERETLQREILATRAELITAEREIERSVCVCVRSEMKLMNSKTSLYIYTSSRNQTFMHTSGQTFAVLYFNRMCRMCHILYILYVPFCFSCTHSHAGSQRSW